MIRSTPGGGVPQSILLPDPRGTTARPRSAASRNVSATEFVVAGTATKLARRPPTVSIERAIRAKSGPQMSISASRNGSRSGKREVPEDGITDS